MRRRALLTAVGALVPAGLAGCAQLRPGRDGGTDASPTDSPPTDSSSTATPESPPSSTPAPPPVTVLEADLVREAAETPDEFVRVAGVARNDADATLEELAIVAAFLDADGAPLDAARAEIDDLDPGERWQFFLAYPGSGEEARAVEDYRLRVEAGE